MGEGKNTQRKGILKSMFLALKTIRGGKVAQANEMMGSQGETSLIEIIKKYSEIYIPIDVANSKEMPESYVLSFSKQCGLFDENGDEVSVMRDAGHPHDVLSNYSYNFNKVISDGDSAIDKFIEDGIDNGTIAAVLKSIGITDSFVLLQSGLLNSDKNKMYNVFKDGVIAVIQEETAKTDEEIKQIDEEIKQIKEETKQIEEENAKIEEEIKQFQEEIKQFQEETKQIEEEAKKIEEETKQIEEENAEMEAILKEERLAFEREKLAFEREKLLGGNTD